MDPRIGDFISKNRKKYTRDAITQQLVEAGHDRADIDATWSALDIPDPDEAALAGEGFWSRFFLFLVGLNVAVFLLVGLTTELFAQGIGLAGIYAVALGIGALISWGIVAAVGPAKLGRTTAIVIGGLIPLVFALLIGGSCFALASVIGPPPLPALSGEMSLRIDEPFSLEGTGPATCQPQRGGTGYGVFAQDLAEIDGQPVYVSVDAYDAQPGERITNVSISALSDTEANPRDWFNTPQTQLQAEVALDGLSGTVTFENLSAGGPDEPRGSGAADGALSGTITWTCEESAP